MDHYTLTLIIGSVDAIVIPWAVWATLKMFELTTKVAVLETSTVRENILQQNQNRDIRETLAKMDKEIDEIKKEINSGFKDILNEMRK
jgi:low affinity Fe/Cu permease